MSDSIVQCSASYACSWWTRVPSYAGAADSATYRLRHHLIEDHGRTEDQAIRQALDTVREQVPE